mmetsp:Transcript_79905/g.158290  ORF Transcript_79905/g.158290 Transcript_79905/m.158290 type:complete len:216 (+) Transcript_79905:547-1194(+)
MRLRRQGKAPRHMSTPRRRSARPIVRNRLPSSTPAQSTTNATPRCCTASWSVTRSMRKVPIFWNSSTEHCDCCSKATLYVKHAAGTVKSLFAVSLESCSTAAWCIRLPVPLWSGSNICMPLRSADSTSWAGILKGQATERRKRKKPSATAAALTAFPLCCARHLPRSAAGNTSLSSGLNRSRTSVIEDFCTHLRSSPALVACSVPALSSKVSDAH